MTKLKGTIKPRRVEYEKPGGYNWKMDFVFTGVYTSRKKRAAEKANEKLLEG